MSGPMAQPLRPLNASGHQPSSTLKFSPPLGGSFIPLVPLASSGRSGLFSHKSTPCVSRRPM